MISNYKLTFFDSPLLYLEEVDSTNLYLKELLNRNPTLKPTAIFADFQTSGRGQYGNSWASAREENLLFSYCFTPYDLSIDWAHLISQEISIVIIDVLNSFLPENEVYVKWPNDIILKDKKIGGILIETSLRDSFVQNFIVGIGINIHQTLFEEHLINASSLSVLYPTIQWDRLAILEKLIRTLESKIDYWQSNKDSHDHTELAAKLRERYQLHLYQFNQEVTVMYHREKYKVMNRGVNFSGNWVLERLDNQELLIIQSSREVEFIFKE